MLFSKVNINDIGIIGRNVPEFNLEKCVGCGLCVSACRQKALKVVDKKVIKDEELCVNCGGCVRACNLNAATSKEKGAEIFVGGRFGREMRLGDLEGSKSLAESLYKKLNSMTSNEEVVLVNELIGYGTLISYYIQLSDNKMVDHCVNKGLEKAKGILKSYPNNSTAKSFIDFYTNK